MDHTTIGRKYNAGKIAYVNCIKNGSLQDVHIQDSCYLLIFLSEGRISVQTGSTTVHAVAPCFLCFDEREDPVFLSATKAQYYCIYFHPKFLNINMTFELIHSENYEDIATTHDLFLLRPFLDRHCVIPICENYQSTIEYACLQMERELREQRDWYWSCRGRSYFMEVIIALERMYGLIGYGMDDANDDSTPSVVNPKLRDAVLFIEGHFMENLTLTRISDAAGINHTTLTALAKEELGVTAMQYLMQYRIKVAKKQLAFTEIPVKDLADRCGFKTVQHFTRVFKEHTNQTPVDYRKEALQKRKKELNNKNL
ncbi:MAG: helix-turn-helix transcriptional regulator [Clostridia bacterium]|nr:helix-turn-helix transcriptional regulator [Clostridia bacterium]MBQ8236393.1 helix-turn-helix transcriptional regulator [Clostridia bacterium]MBQ8398367.1 helix-turn-helix transcriptional regulator [Clostridia bacterium]